MRRAVAAAGAGIGAAAVVLLLIRVLRPDHLYTPGRNAWWTVGLVVLSVGVVPAVARDAADRIAEVVSLAAAGAGAGRGGERDVSEM